MLTTLKPGYYLGIDGGGTKTEAVIADESGYVISRGTAGGANPHNYPLDIAFENVRMAVIKAQEGAQLSGKQINLHQFETICIGLAGIDTQSDRDNVSQYINNLPFGNRPFDGNKLILCNDGFIGLKSATDENWGVCLISSTGSNCYGVNRLGKESTAGDWGYLLGDQGSGFALGMKLIHRVIKEYDGRCANSKLTPIVMKHLGLTDPTELIPWAYNGHVPVKEIASLSQVLNDPDLQNTLYISDYVSYTAKALVDSYHAVIHRLELQNEAFPVVLVGGLFNLKIPLKERINQAIMEITPKARVMSTTHSPAEGAIKVAQMGNLQKLFPDSFITFIDPK
jgi:N-acetylglucosamine kinase-like BadF-type ATPase